MPHFVVGLSFVFHHSIEMALEQPAANRLPLQKQTHKTVKRFTIFLGTIVFIVATVGLSQTRP